MRIRTRLHALELTLRRLQVGCLPGLLILDGLDLLHDDVVRLLLGSLRLPRRFRCSHLRRLRRLLLLAKVVLRRLTLLLDALRLPRFYLPRS